MSSKSFMHRRIAGALLLPLAVALSGCGSDDDGGSPAAGGLTVAPSLGLVRYATVVVKDGLGNTVGSGSTEANGVAYFSAATGGPYVIEIHGDADAEYFDENIGDFVPFTSGVLHALVPAGSNQVTVTGLTELAWSLWQAGGAPLSAENIALANAAVLDFFAPAAPAGLDDILDTPRILGAVPVDGTLSNTADDLHALLLAALAGLGDGDTAGTPALTVISQLSQDLSDGVIDGADGDGPLDGLRYDHTTLAADIADQLALRAADWGNSAIETLALGYTLGALEAPAWVGSSEPVVITGVSATSGAVGNTVTITGTGFDADPFHMQVLFFSAVAAEIVSASATELVVTVPAGATTGPLYVNNILSGFSYTTSEDFTVTDGGGGGGDPGDTWTSRTSPSGYVLTSIAWGNDTFVAAGMGKTILTSTDGVSWTTRTGPDNNWFQANAVTWDGTRFILVGDTTVYTPATPIIATSTDGITWTRRTWTPASTTYSLIDVTAAGGTITAVAGNGSITSSTDGGVTWADETQTLVSTLAAVAANGTTRVAVGINEILVNSGSGWVAATGAGSFAGKDVVWTGTQFVAVGADSINYGANSVVLTSTDGTSWTRHALPDTAAPAGYSLLAVTVQGPTLYASGTNGGTGHHIVSSTDGATWTLAYQGAAAAGQGQLAGIAASSSTIVTVGGVKSVTSP